MYKYPASAPAAAVDDDQPTIHINSLGLIVDPNSPNFAKFPPIFPAHSGTVLFVCADGRALPIMKLRNIAL